MTVGELKIFLNTIPDDIEIATIETCECCTKIISAKEKHFVIVEREDRNFLFFPTDRFEVWQGYLKTRNPEHKCDI